MKKIDAADPKNKKPKLDPIEEAKKLAYELKQKKLLESLAKAKAEEAEAAKANKKKKKKDRKKGNCFPPQFRDLLSSFDLCRKASFVKQAESVAHLHKAFVFDVLLISNLQLNWRVALR